MITDLSKKAKQLLIDLINTPSFSGDEDGTASLIEEFLKVEGIVYQRDQHNIWALNEDFDDSKPSILLNSHHDTVKPNKGYTRDPHRGVIEEGKLFGLGSNDAGGCLVSLIATFKHFYKQKGLKYNLILLASAEEENSGKCRV